MQTIFMRELHKSREEKQYSEDNSLITMKQKESTLWTRKTNHSPGVKSHIR